MSLPKLIEEQSERDRTKRFARSIRHSDYINMSVGGFAALEAVHSLGSDWAGHVAEGWPLDYLIMTDVGAAIEELIAWRDGVLGEYYAASFEPFEPREE